MHMITIILAMGLLLHDAYGASGGFEGFAQQNWLWVVTVLLLPKLLLLLIYQKLCQQALKIPSTRRFKRLDRFGFIFRLLLLTSYAMDLTSGCLNWVRETLGDWVLLDESVVLLPTLLAYLLLWRIYYPVDRKVREAMAFAAVDAGEPVPPIWTMNQYLLAQIRHSLLIPGVPLLILLGWTETLNMAPASWITLPGSASEPGMSLYTPLSLGGAALVFLSMPVMIRWLWDTHAMPPSPMRLRLLQLCKDYRVGVREILYWKTFGGMANGAVIGFISPLRYILLTDVLLSQMAPSNIEAVMAHEIAHIRKKHMFWMIGGAGAMIVIYQLVFSIGFWGLGQYILDHVSNPKAFEAYINDNTISVMALILGGMMWLLCFGWMSRKMERQADSFAVAHMAKADGRDHIEPHDAATMINALSDVARLNHVSPQRKSWRHGSIAWRQQYLQNLVGQKVSRLPIDRTMRKICALIVLGIVLSTWLLMGGVEKLEDYLTTPKEPKVILVHAQPVIAPFTDDRSI